MLILLVVTLLYIEKSLGLLFILSFVLMKNDVISAMRARLGCWQPSLYLLVMRHMA